MMKTGLTTLCLSLASIVVALTASTCHGERQSSAKHYAKPPEIAAGGSDEGKLNMDYLEVKITTGQAEVFPDESVDIEITLVNNDSVSHQAPSPESVCPFKFVLRSAKENHQVQVTDAVKASEARVGDPGRERDPEMVPLDPGASLTYEYDLADFYLTPVPPNIYNLSVIYREEGVIKESAGAAITLISPNISALAIIYGLSADKIDLIFAHTAADGSITLCQREGYPDRAHLGVVCRRNSIAPPRLVTGVANAIELYYNEGIRWYAWLEGDALGAGVAQYRTLFAQMGPVPLGLSSPTLQNQGWQFSSESATFAVMGTDQQGRVAFAAVPFPEPEDGGVKPVPLSLSTLPSHWLARYRKQGEKYQFDIVSAVESAGTTRLVRETVDPEAGKVDSEVLLTERNEPLVALSLDLVTEKEHGTVDALFGPTGDEAIMTFLRLPLDGGEPAAEWTFSAPMDLEKKRPAAWAITPDPLPDPVVLAKLGSRLLFRRAKSGSEWVALVEDAAGAEHLRLVVMGSGAVWAIWADPVQGIRYQQVRYDL